MTRLAFTVAGAGAAALALAACAPPHPHPHPQAALRAIASLDCPATQGDLTRQSATSDGKSCLYADDQGSQVTLRLIALNGQGPDAALASVEAGLRSDMPPGAAAGTSGTDKDRVDIDLPGVHIHANGDEAASVQAGSGARSVTVTDGGGRNEADTGKPGVSVFAGDSGAEVRANEPGSGVRRALILATDHPGPDGYKAVGYDARGPLGGPLVVVAVLKAKSGNQQSLKGDMRDLLRLNVGG